MSAVSFAYIVQLNMPGLPLKIGHSRRPMSRLQQFQAGTPVQARLLGITLNGKARERDMLNATSGAIIHGEWRRCTDDLMALATKYFADGEWFVRASDPKALFEQMRVEERASPYAQGYKVRPCACDYFWSGEVLEAAHDDPLLGIHWNGFEQAIEPPSFQWPALSLAA